MRDDPSRKWRVQLVVAGRADRKRRGGQTYQQGGKRQWEELFCLWGLTEQHEEVRNIKQFV